VATQTVEQAARVALDVQETIGDLQPVQTGLPGRVAFRLGAHVGPVFLSANPVRGSLDVVGEHVNRTARLEPVTPPGEVYVTDAFAAALELAGVDDLACDYVGHLPGAKDIGRMRMHRLHRTTRGGASG
jgi:class 3 adenylate cyclase